MRQAATLFAGPLLLAVAACGQHQGDESGAPRSAANGFLGSVTYQYDPVLLTAANVRIAVPPADGGEAYAIKLLPAHAAEGSATLCPGGAEACSIEAQPGVTLALLERPFERYERALRESDLAGGIAPIRVGGTDGIAIDAGTEGGLSVQYRLVPVDNRALLIKLQSDGESAEEEKALEQVVASLDLGG